MSSPPNASSVVSRPVPGHGTTLLETTARVAEEAFQRCRRVVAEMSRKCGPLRLLLLHRPHDRQFSPRAPVLERPVVEARLVARLTRREVEQTSLLSDVAVRNDTITRLHTGSGEHVCNRRPRFEH